ncbi:hypothetical protein ES703_38444 [subsurface metagenome]
MPEGSFTVEAIRRKLRRSPPVIGALVRFFDKTEEYLDWVRIVRDLLPEREAEILAATTVPEQISLFVSHFETRYFPLQDSFAWDEEEFSYGDFLRCIPVQVSGWTWETYHEMEDYRTGMQLMTFLFNNPFEDEDGARVVLAEMCAEHVRRQTLESVPQGGIKIDAAEQLLKGSPYQALYEWGLYMYSDTGNFFLDTDYEYLWSGYGSIDWARDTIEQLTREWQLQEEFNRRFVAFAEWLEEDPEKHFQEILAFIHRKEGEMNDADP